MQVLKLDDVCLTYFSNNGETEALKNISFSVAAGDFVSIVGPSGCGKSTILSILANLESKTSGDVIFYKDLTIGYMLQDDCLFFWRTILENCLIGLEVSGNLTEENIEYVLSLLKTYGLYEFKDKYPASLSGGMRQRVLRILYTHGIITYKWLITLINNGKEVYYVIR